MPPAGRLHVRVTPRGRTLLLMDNRLVNVGPGPLEFRSAVRTGPREMTARQIVSRAGGRSRVALKTGAELYFKYVGAAHGYAYWKFDHAAVFQLWRMDAAGPGVPALPFYGPCSQTQRIRSVTLGVSVGWADGYPYTYPENWIDVTGRRGCYAIVQRADPLGHVLETDEADNTSVQVVRLPYRPGPQRCPRYAGPSTPGS
jgi:hypothetical protein